MGIWMWLFLLGPSISMVLVDNGSFALLSIEEGVSEDSDVRLEEDASDDAADDGEPKLPKGYVRGNMFKGGGVGRHNEHNQRSGGLLAKRRDRLSVDNTDNMTITVGNQASLIGEMPLLLEYAGDAMSDSDAKRGRILARARATDRKSSSTAAEKPKLLSRRNLSTTNREYEMANDVQNILLQSLRGAENAEFMFAAS